MTVGRRPAFVGVARHDEEVSLTGLPFLVVLLLLAVALMAGTLISWDRWPGRLALPARILSLVLMMVLGAALAGDAVNRSFDFYSSFGDLLGLRSAASTPVTASGPRQSSNVVIGTPDWMRAGRLNAARSRGELVTVTFAGPDSHLERDGLVYLPAAYFTGSADRRFAAVELFPGYPGRPSDYERHLGIDRLLDAEIKDGRLPPVVAVLPRTYTRGSSECVDAVRGERNATFLSVDVPQDVIAALRVLPGRAWGAAGYSTGGFCAVNLGLHHPERYAAAASLSGFFTAGEDPGSGRLYAGSGTARRLNSPLWWAQHRHPAAPPLYLFASTGDPAAVREQRAMRQALHRYAAALPTEAVLLPEGGHNYSTFGAGLGPALDWLAGYLPGPLRPAMQLPAAPG